VQFSSFAPASRSKTEGLAFVLARVEARIPPAGPAVDRVRLEVMTPRGEEALLTANYDEVVC